MKPETIDKVPVGKLEDVVPEYYSYGRVKHSIYLTTDFGPCKPCSACKMIKPLSDFHTDSSNGFGLTYNCKTCANGNSRKNHKARMQDEDWVKDKRAKSTERFAKRKRKAVEYKGDKCFDCGNKYQDCVYDFHHLNGDTKTDNPSAIIRKSWESAKKELETCVLLCANCHRIRHFGKT